MIAVLYIDPRGPYPKMADVDCWDESRDARLYDGSWPVVAHPPCGPWSKLARFYNGIEHDCAPRAVEQVRAWGGILEHPRGSALWGQSDLPPVGGFDDVYGGFSIEVSQVDWGHVARKRTWLYLVGVPRSAIVLPEPRQPTHWASGSRGENGRCISGTGGGVPPGMKVCSAQQRRRTPVAFAEWLVALASQSAVRRAA